MTPETARSIARAASRRRLVAAIYSRLAVVLESVDTPLNRLLRYSDDVTIAFIEAERQYGIAFSKGSPSAKDAALEGYLAVQQAAAQFLGAEAIEVERLLAGRIQLLAGGPEALAIRANDLVGTVEGRALRRVERVARRWTKRDLTAAVMNIEGILLKTVSAAESSPAKEALLAYLNGVRPNDYSAWRTVAQRAASFRTLSGKLRRVRAAGGYEAFGDARFRDLLSSEGGVMKGVLGEVFTWRSRPWLIREHELVRSGAQRGRILAAGGADFRPHVVREPLLLGNTEIYDGSVMLARPLASGNNIQIFDAFPHATLQVQTRDRMSLFGVLGSDKYRELASRPHGLELRTADYSKTFIVRPAPDGQPPTRYIFAPMLDQASEAALPPGAKVVFVPQLLSSDEFGEVAFLILRSFI